MGGAGLQRTDHLAQDLGGNVGIERGRLELFGGADGLVADLGVHAGTNSVGLGFSLTRFMTSYFPAQK